VGGDSMTAMVAMMASMMAAAVGKGAPQSAGIAGSRFSLLDLENCQTWNLVVDTDASQILGQRCTMREGSSGKAACRQVISVTRQHLHVSGVIIAQALCRVPNGTASVTSLLPPRCLGGLDRGS